MSITHTPSQTVELFGYPVHLLSSAEAVERLSAYLSDDQTAGLHVVTLNPEMMMQGDQDPQLAHILKNAGLVVADGAGVVWALRSKGIMANRLPGIELSEKLLAEAAQKNYRVAIIGAASEVLDAAIANLSQKYSGLNVVYRHHGYFQDGEASDQIAQACAQTQPQVLLVALGVPRQEKWIATYQKCFPKTVLVGIGGSLDVWSGKSKRAPAVMRMLNLEWLYRISREPWRIRRIYKPLPLFVLKVLFDKIGIRTPHPASSNSGVRH